MSFLTSKRHVRVFGVTAKDYIRHLLTLGEEKLGTALHTVWSVI